MMKYELKAAMRGFLDEIKIIIELGEYGLEIPTDIAKTTYYMDAHGNGHIMLVPTSILTRKSSNPTETQQVLKRLIDFIEENNIEDECANDGDGHYDTWRSGEFERLIEKAKEVTS